MTKPKKTTYNPVRTVFMEHFDAIWTKLFTSPVHLDSAISKAPPSIKAPLAEITRVILQRPNSIAYYLGFHLSEGEPWGLSQDEIAEWKTARDMADRLFKTWKHNPDFKEGGSSYHTDFPPEILHELEGDFGRKTTNALIKTLAQDAPLSLRASRKFPYLETLSLLNDSGLLPERAKRSQVSPVGIVIPKHARILHTKEHLEGRYEIQDEGSQVMAFFALWPELFKPYISQNPGKFEPLPEKFALPETIDKTINVVDACAGAGGKTLALADALKGRGQVYAYDISEKKLLSLRQRAKRAGVNSIKTVPVSLGKENEVVKKFAGTADVVLVDAPCTGWGVLRRNPDIKWRQSQEVRERMPQIQLEILKSYAPLVKPGGRLVYGVCTFRKVETTKIVEDFLASEPDFKPLIGGYLGPHSADGFYMFAFTRKAKKS